MWLYTLVPKPYFQYKINVQIVSEVPPTRVFSYQWEPLSSNIKEQISHSFVLFLSLSLVYLFFFSFIPFVYFVSFFVFNLWLIVFSVVFFLLDIHTCHTKSDPRDLSPFWDMRWKGSSMTASKMFPSPGRLPAGMHLTLFWRYWKRQSSQTLITETFWHPQ